MATPAAAAAAAAGALPAPLNVTVPEGRRLWRVLGFGKHPEGAAMAEAGARALGYNATAFALTDDAAGDAKLVSMLEAERFDAVAIGGYINGQNPEYPPTDETYHWFVRVLNIIVKHGRGAKIALARNPKDAAHAFKMVLGDDLTTPIEG